MKKSDYAGWKDVFAFSFSQGIKEKSFLGFLIISALIILLALPISAWMNSKDEEEVPCGIETITIYNESGLVLDQNLFLSDERYANVKMVSDSKESFDDAVKRLEDTKESKEVLIKMEYTKEENSFKLTFVKAAKADLNNKDCTLLTTDFQAGFMEAKKNALEVTDEQEAFIAQNVESHVNMVSISENGEIVEEENNKAEGISLDEYQILLFAIIIVVFMVSFTAGSIANSVVTEKSTRVVEYLMINVRPNALIVGKILASLLEVVIQFIVLGVCYGLAKVITNVIVGPTEGASQSTMAVAYDMLSKANPLSLIIGLLTILTGILFFCIVAGLCGASVSKLEELAEAMKIYQLFMIGGSYAAIGICIMQMTGGVNVWVIRICSLIPLVAPFIIPANLLLGKISMGIALAGFLILAVVTALLFSFTAKVYESMIFYNGTPLKLKDIIGIAKNRSTGKKEGK